MILSLKAQIKLLLTTGEKKWLIAVAQLVEQSSDDSKVFGFEYNRC
jgi:hypothetical protein